MRYRQTTSSNSGSAFGYNAATRVVVSSLGALLGISSMDHGVLEMMQGDVPTPGSFLKALGPGHSWTLWVHGSEPAFTIVHNFLLTGMLATAMGILLIVWSAGFIDRRYGPTIFLLISIASFLTGGGLAQVLLFTLTWATATRIHAPLRLWQRILPARLRTVLARMWSPALISAAILFLAALEIATIGYFPGLPHETQALTRILWRLAAAIISAVVLAILGGLAHDLEAGAMGSRFPQHASRQSVVHRG
jgi:hypothetical protein